MRASASRSFSLSWYKRDNAARAELEHVGISLAVVGEEGLDVVTQVGRAGERLQIAELRRLADLDSTSI